MSQALLVGSAAPGFKVKDVHGVAVNLREIKSQYAIVAFMRYAGCPWCNLAIHRLTYEQRLLEESDCSVVAFVQSSKENILKHIYERHERKPWFPIIADNQMKTYKKYFVQPSLVKSRTLLTNIPQWVHSVKKHGFKNKTIDGSLFLVPAMFLVVPATGEILRVDYKANVYEHETFTNIYETIQYRNLNGKNLGLPEFA